MVPPISPFRQQALDCHGGAVSASDTTAPPCINPLRLTKGCLERHGQYRLAVFSFTDGHTQKFLKRRSGDPFRQLKRTTSSWSTGRSYMFSNMVTPQSFHPSNFTLQTCLSIPRFLQSLPQLPQAPSYRLSRVTVLNLRPITTEPQPGQTVCSRPWATLPSYIYLRPARSPASSARSSGPALDDLAGLAGDSAARAAARAVAEPLTLPAMARRLLTLYRALGR